MADQIVSIPNETGTRRAHENIPDRGDDWVLSGCNFVPGFDASELKVTHGELLIADSGTLYWVKRGTTTGLSFGGGTSSVYYVVDTSDLTGSVQVGGSPSQPYLELGTVDASGQTTSTSNRDPTYSVTNTERAVIGTIEDKSSGNTHDPDDIGSGGGGETTRTENTLADAGKAQLLDVAQTAARVTVIDETNDELSLWFLRGTNNDAQLLFDSNSHFTNSEDNDTTVNIYWDATNTRYEVNNETGGQITVAAIDVRET